MAFNGEQVVLDKLLKAQDDDARAEILQIMESNPSIQANIDRLKEIKQEMERAHLILEVQTKSAQPLRQLLTDQIGLSLITDQATLDVHEQLITERTFEAYHLTSQILQDLGWINKVSYTYTVIDDNFNYQRSTEIDLQLDDMKMQSNGAGGQGLRLQEAAIKMKIQQNQNQEAMELLNKHFQAFAGMFIDYQNTTHTGWKINRGNLAETFERHWENEGHSLEDTVGLTRNAIGNDLESKGMRWFMYRQSSGSDPYYTGPDTLYSQVKSANASLVSNINTVLNAMKAIIDFFDNIYSVENIGQKLNKAFKQAIMKSSIPSNIWDGIEIATQQELANEMANYLGTTTDNMTMKLSKTRGGANAVFKAKKLTK